MPTTQKKLQYFWDSLVKTAKSKDSACPSCGHLRSHVVDRKFAVTRLQRCGNCQLLYRAPTTTDEEYRRYYQQDYSEGFTTDLPSLDELGEMRRLNFAGTEKDYSRYVEVLRALGCGPGDRLLDFGCSWGYGSWQLSQAGFGVKSIELSQRRREFAHRHLGVEVYSDSDEIEAGTFDVFFSSHVLEHIPKLSGIIDLARRAVRPGGWFVAFTPNGSSGNRNTDPKAWHQIWGFVHPLCLDDVFYQSFFLDSRYLIDSSPYATPEIAAWARTCKESAVLRRHGQELLIAVRF